MKRHIFAGVVLLAMIAGPVLAEGTNWTGFYVGLNSGYSFGRSDAHYTDPALRIYSIDSNPDGWSIGMQAGLNYQLNRGIFNRVVLGLEAEFSYVDVSDTIYDSLSEAHGRPNNSIKTSSDYAGTGRARIGYAAGRFLPYMTAGVSGANAKVTATDGSLSESAFLVGWTAGAGIEYALTKNWSVRTEYLYIDLGEHTWFSGKFWESSAGLISNTVRLGLNYKF